MKKIMGLVILALMAAMAFAGCGKTDAATPKGIYGHNGNTLDFSGGKVIITEGGVSTSCDYTSDKDGNLVIDPKGEEIPASYDADADVVTVDHVKYRKGSGSAENGDGFSAEEPDSIPEDMAAEEGYNDDMFSNDYLSLTEEGPMLLCLIEPGWGRENEGYIAKYKSYDKDPDEFVEVYKELGVSGNKVTVATEDGRERVWVFDEEEGTLSSEGYCFYRYSKRTEYIYGKIAASDKTLEGNYTGIYEGSWHVSHGALQPASRVANFQFHADHTLESTLDEEYRFLGGMYLIEDGYFYTYTEADGRLRVGTYDEASDTITIMEMGLTKATGE